MMTRKKFLAIMQSFAERNKVLFYDHLFDQGSYIDGYVTFSVDLDCNDLLAAKSRIDNMRNKLSNRFWVVDSLYTEGTKCSFRAYYIPNVEHSDSHLATVMQIKNNDGVWEDEMIASGSDRDALKDLQFLSDEYVKSGFKVRFLYRNIPLHEGHIINMPTI